MPPAARVTDPHACPAESPEPHVGGPILPVGHCPDILINGLPAAVLGTLATCDGPPAEIITGSATVFFNGKPAARMGDLTSHGGFILAGSPNVIIGDEAYAAPGSASIAGLSCVDKMKKALEHAPWEQGLVDALGGAKGVAALVVGMVVLQFVPIAGEVEDALVVIGTLLAGGNVLKGLAELKRFHDVCCNEAKTEADLEAAGKIAADALATIGVNALLAMLPFVTKTLKGTKNAEGNEILPAARLPQDVAVDPKPPDVLPLDRPISSDPRQNAKLQADRVKAEAEGGKNFRVNQQQVNADGVRVGTNRPDLQYTDADGQRVYKEYDSYDSDRGPEHEIRILANDPSGKVILEKFPPR